VNTEETAPGSDLTEGTATASQEAQAGWRVFTIPNILTMLRIVSAPVFLALFMIFGQSDSADLRQLGLQLLLGIAVASELSDLLDGYLARRLKVVSNFGKFMDPYADSIFRLTAFFCFASQIYGKWVPLWMVVILLYRDITTSIVRTFGLGKRKVISARLSGKLKALLQSAVIITVLAIGAFWGPEAIAASADLRRAVGAMMWTTMIVAVLSGIDYLWANRHLFRE